MNESFAVQDKIHEEMIRKYSSSKDDYTGKNGYNMILTPSLVKYYLLQYFSTRDLSILKKIHYAITRSKKGIADLIKKGDETTEGKKDAKKHLAWKNSAMNIGLLYDLKEEYRKADFWLSERYKDKKQLAVIDLLPVNIAKKLEEYFENRYKGILLQLSLACDTTMSWYYDLYQIWEQSRQFEKTTPERGGDE